MKYSELTSTRYAEAVMEISELLTTPTFQVDPLSTLTHETAVRYHEAWMRRDLEGLMALYHPAVEYHDFFQNRTIDYAQLRDYLSASMPTGAREIQIYTDRLRIDGDTAFLQYGVTLNGSDTLLSFHAIEALSAQKWTDSQGERTCGAGQTSPSGESTLSQH